MFNESRRSTLEKCEEVIFVLFALIIPLVTLPSMLGV